VPRSDEESRHCDREELLAGPLEHFAALHAATLRSSRAGVIDLSYPNPRFARDDRAFGLLGSLLARISQEDLQYTAFAGGTIVRRRIASALSRRLGLRIGLSGIVLTPGATAALSIAFAVLFQPGDEILVVTPCWMDYHLYLLRLGLKTVEVPSGDGKRLDLPALAAAWGPDTAGVVISQPACPTGVLHSASELDALAGLLREVSASSAKRPILVSDEVHRDQVWDGALVSPMQAYPDTVSVYSFGKAWSLQGQRTGYLALGPALSRRDELAARVDRAVRSMGFCAPTALMQRLVLEIVDLEPDHGTLRDDQLRLRALLAGLGYEAVPAQATGFVYVRCPPGSDDWGFVRRLARNGVLAMPSELFHEGGYFRLAINVPAGEFDEVARRLRAALPVTQDSRGRPGTR
jgi:aspartate aminotransferase